MRGYGKGQSCKKFGFCHDVVENLSDRPERSRMGKDRVGGGAQAVNWECFWPVRRPLPAMLTAIPSCASRSDRTMAGPVARVFGMALGTGIGAAGANAGVTG